MNAQEPRWDSFGLRRNPSARSILEAEVSMPGFLDQEEARRMLAAGAVVVDVRTQEEWDAGHAEASILIPLHELPVRLGELSAEHPVLLVCRSGARSGQATTYLCHHGLDAHNLGPWQRNPSHPG